MNQDLIAAIESDVAAHNRLRRWLPWLASAAVLVGGLWGAVIGVTVTKALFTPMAETGPTVALLLFAMLGSALALGSRRLGGVWRWALVALFAVAGAYWKFFVMHANAAELAAYTPPHGGFAHDFTCFLLGFAASAAMVVAMAVVHVRLGLAPSLWARSTGALVAAASGLVAQGLYCGDVTVEHVAAAHLGQAVVAVVAVLGIDAYLVDRRKKIWTS